jgi:hypothetical protein
LATSAVGEPLRRMPHLRYSPPARQAEATLAGCGSGHEARSRCAGHGTGPESGRQAAASRSQASANSQPVRMSVGQCTPRYTRLAPTAPAASSGAAWRGRPPARAVQAPAVRAASVVCFDGRLNPSGWVSQTAAGGRGRVICCESLRRATMPLATTRHGAAAARQRARPAFVAANAISTVEANAGSASALTALATATTAGRRPPRRAPMAFSSMRRSQRSPRRMRAGSTGPFFSYAPEQDPLAVGQVSHAGGLLAWLRRGPPPSGLHHCGHHRHLDARGGCGRLPA